MNPWHLEMVEPGENVRRGVDAALRRRVQVSSWFDDLAKIPIPEQHRERYRKVLVEMAEFR